MSDRKRPTRTADPVSKTIGRPGTKSRLQADSNAEVASRQQQEMVPLASDGHPLSAVEIAAQELIPTGQFANVSISARIRHWVDAREETPISEEELANLARAANQLAELVEIDVVAVQRNLVLESIQSQVSSDNGKS